MQAGKAVDSHGLQPDYTIEQADAEAAYTQCELKGTPTWVRLPPDRWPDSWYYWKDGKKGAPRFTDPVCRLKKALYGHPDAGTYWEQHAEKHLRSVGFAPIQDWRSCFDLAALFTSAGEETIIDGPWCTLVRRDAKSVLPCNYFPHLDFPQRRPVHW